MKTILKYTMVFIGLFFGIGISAFAQPDWAVDPYEFVHSMTISGKVTTDGYFSTDTNDKVAAFINGECVGVANIVYKASLNDYYLFLLIYSNETSGTVTFKIYDASDDEIYDAKETINFTVNDIIGTAADPFIFSASNLNNQAQLLSFTIPNQEGETFIQGNNVSLQERWSGSLTNIVASFTVSDGAKVYVSGVEQESGITTNDFIYPVEYEIVAADNSASTKYIITITTANDIPTDILLSNAEKEENDNLSFIGYFTTVTENSAEPHVFSLVSAVGSENEHFYISGSGLRARGAFNYEEKSSFKIYVRADDEKGGVVEKYFTIRVKDVNDAPYNIALTNTYTPANTPANTIISTLVAFDEDNGDSHTFALVSGNGSNDSDNGKFYVDGDKLKSATTLPFLDGDEYKIYVESKDLAGESVKIALVITPLNQGNPPYSLSLSNTQIVGIDNPPILVGMLETQDIDQIEGHVFSLPEDTVNGPDNTYFSITNKGLYLSSPLPISEQNTYSILIAVTDSMNNQFTKTFTILVKEKLGNLDFYMSSNVIKENQPFNTVIGYFETANTSERAGYNFELPLDVDLSKYKNDKFKLSGRTLLSNEIFDYETEKSIPIQLEIFDGLEWTTQEIKVDVSDQNDPPTSVSLSNQIISESAEINAIIATISAHDQDLEDIHQFSLVIGNGINDEANGIFKISGNNLILTKSLNFEDKESHNILIRVTDKGGATFEQGLRLQVANANDGPQFISTPPPFILQDQVFAYAIQTTDSEGDDVELNFEGLPTWLKHLPGTNILSGTPGNSAVGNFSFSIIASDGNKSTTQQIMLTVINVNDAPKINYTIEKQLFRSKQENEVMLPADCFTDPDQGDILTFTLLGENNTSLPDWLTFSSINLSLKGNPPESAAGKSYRFKLIATDSGNLSEWMIFELEVSFPTAAGYNEVAEFRVYPNPVKNELNLSIPSATDNAEVRIQNIEGKEIKVFNFSSGSKNRIPVHDLSPGVYFIKLLQGETQFIEKMIKK